MLLKQDKEEAAFLILQAPMTFMSRQSVFINTSPPSERTFLVKSKKQLDPDSTDVAVDNLICHYQKRCIHYEKFNEDLEEALENAASKEYEENMSTSGEEVENNTFGFFDPDHDENLKQYDIGLDLGIGT